MDKLNELETYINNDPHLYKSIVFCVNHLRSVVNRGAEGLAKANAAWNDDAESSDYAEMHSSADVQYNKQVRDVCAMELVRYYLGELQ